MRFTFSFLFLSAALTLNPSSLAKAGNKSPDFFKEVVDELAKENGVPPVSEQISVPSLRGPIPLGDSKGAVPPECHPQEFQRRALALYENAHQYAQLVSSYFENCEKFLTEGNSKGIPALLKFASTEYNLDQNPQITKQLLRLSDGSRVETYIGVKDLQTPRPWVIVKCGVFCDITSSASTLNFVINFFDQSPFNVIFLSNHTGNTHIKVNQALTLGGFYEVYDLYDIAHWLKYDSPYQNTVDSIHATGISLGGSSAMAVSHLSSLYRSREGKPIFDSTMAICPVVNLGPTLKDMYSNTNKGKLFTRLTWKYLKEAAPYLESAQDYLQAKVPPSADKFPLMLTDIVLRYGTKWERTSPPGRSSATSPSNIEEFARFNHFSADREPIEVPTFVWASHDDHVVNFDLNTKTLIDSPNQFNNQGAVGVNRGDHCGFVTTYGFSATTAVLQSFVLNNSPNFIDRRHPRVLAFPGKTHRLSLSEIHLRQWWIADPKQNYVTLHFETFNPTLGLACRLVNPFQSTESCRQKYSQKIALKDLAALGVTIPQNDTEAQILSRQLNYKVRLTHGGQTIDGTVLPPSHISWYDY